MLSYGKIEDYPCTFSLYIEHHYEFLKSNFVNLMKSFGVLPGDLLGSAYF